MPCHLRGRGTAQVEATSWLSVVARSGPCRTAVNGTLVARPSRMTPLCGRAVGSTLTLRVRVVLREHRLVGKSPEGSRQPGGDLNPGPILAGHSRLWR
jgi:hypothetical protein